MYKCWHVLRRCFSVLQCQVGANGTEEKSAMCDYNMRGQMI